MPLGKEAHEAGDTLSRSLADEADHLEAPVVDHRQRPGQLPVQGQQAVSDLPPRLATVGRVPVDGGPSIAIDEHVPRREIAVEADRPIGVAREGGVQLGDELASAHQRVVELEEVEMVRRDRRARKVGEDLAVPFIDAEDVRRQIAPDGLEVPKQRMDLGRPGSRRAASPRPRVT